MVKSIQVETDTSQKMETVQTAPNLSSPDSQQPLSLSQHEEWQGKLTLLQDEHKLESLQQQREHLEQLKNLQTQLLRELSSDVNRETALPTQDVSKSKQQDLTSPTKQDEKENTIFLSPEKHSSGIKVTPVQSQEYVPPPRTNPVVKHSPPRKSPQKYSPARTPPPYTIPGPQSVWESEATSPRISWTGPGTPHSSSRGDSFSRGSLVAKHNKHVEDLKKYYESELRELQTQLEKVEPGEYLQHYLAILTCSFFYLMQ